MSEVQKLKKKDFVSDQDIRWRPGCGDYTILNTVQKVFPELDFIELPFDHKIYHQSFDFEKGLPKKFRQGKILFRTLQKTMSIKSLKEFIEEGMLGSGIVESLEKDKKNQDFDDNFAEIAPLVSSFDFDLQKQKSDFEILDFECLPESVYMIVDKKVELELQLISDLPEWSFLPENELQRKAILLFSNQRSAKRICSRSQRVIKIPNTSVFKLSQSYLISKGITRLILEDSIIGLDN